MKAKACFGTWEETSNCGSTIALFATKPNLVLLTSWVSYIDNFILAANLMDARTQVADTPSGWASRRLRSGLTLVWLTDTPSEVTDNLVGTRWSWVFWVAEFINQ